MISRRGLLRGAASSLIVAPAVVSVASLMPLRGHVLREWRDLVCVTPGALGARPSVEIDRIMRQMSIIRFRCDLGRPLTEREIAGWDRVVSYDAIDGVHWAHTIVVA